MIKDDLNDSFELISQSNAQTESLATDRAKKMNDIFLEIEELRQNYPNTLNYFPNEIQSEKFLNTWTKKLTEKHDELEIEIERHKLSKELCLF